MVTSSDGVLVVTSAPVAAVSIDVNWGAAGGVMPWRTTVTRTVGSTVTTVRSGDLAYSPGGVVHVHDNEAPIEGVLVYTAFGYDAFGVFFRNSMPVTVALPNAVQTMWLKCVGNPSLSQRVTPSGPPLGEAWATPTQVFNIPGNPFPVVYEDVQSAMTGSVTVLVQSEAEYRALYALSGCGVLLLQASNADYAIPGDIFLRSPQLTSARPGSVRGWGVRELTMPFVEVARPSTAGSPLLVPGWTNDVAAARYATYTAFDAAFASYAAQSAGP